MSRARGFTNTAKVISLTGRSFVLSLDAALRRIEGEILIPNACTCSCHKLRLELFVNAAPKSCLINSSLDIAPSHFGILFLPLENVGLRTERERSQNNIYFSLASRLSIGFNSLQPHKQLFMRFAQFTTIFRTLGLFSTFSRPQATRILSRQPAFIKSMPSFPLFSNLFGSSNHASSNMSFPDQRSQDEWRAVLNPGM